MFNDVLDKNKLFLTIKKKFIKVPKIVFFQRGITHVSGEKKFSVFRFGQNKARINA